MKRLLILALVLIAFPATAGEKPAFAKWLDRYEMPAADRARFKAAIQSAYDPSCDCFLFLVAKATNPKERGKVTKVRKPKNDGDRRLIIEFIRRGWWVPLSTTGPGH